MYAHFCFLLLYGRIWLDTHFEDFQYNLLKQLMKFIDDRLVADKQVQKDKMHRETNVLCAYVYIIVPFCVTFVVVGIVVVVVEA